MSEQSTAAAREFKLAADAMNRATLALYLEVPRVVAEDVRRKFQNYEKAVNTFLAASRQSGAAPSTAPTVEARKLDGKFSVSGSRVVNTVSGEVIPEDEPLFLLRARDGYALAAIHAYQGACENSCNELHMAGIQQVREKFCQFAAEHPERMKQPGITRHLKLEAATPAPPVAPTATETRALDLYEQIYAAREVLREALAEIRSKGDCACDHSDDSCCALVGEFCPECIAAQALGSAEDIVAPRGAPVAPTEEEAAAEYVDKQIAAMQKFGSFRSDADGSQRRRLINEVLQVLAASRQRAGQP